MNKQEGKFIVGVVGTQNTGKSTFIKDIVERFKGTENEFRTVGCDYRKKIEEKGLSINRKGNLESQKIIFNTLVEQLAEISGMEGGNYITDRSPIDAYVYTVYLFRHSPELGITQDDVDTMFNEMRMAIDSYDRIIYLDLNNCYNVEVVDDKFRDTDPAYRFEIDQIFKETFDKLGQDFKNDILNSNIHGDRETRVEQFIGMEGIDFVVPYGEGV